MEPLTSNRWEKVELAENFPKPQKGQLVRIQTITRDNSALLHAVLNAFFTSYRTGRHNGAVIDRVELVQNFRLSLAKRLTEPIKGSSYTVYDCLSKGRYKQLSQTIKAYEINALYNQLLDPTFFIDDTYLELIANEIGKNIYIVDSTNGMLFVKDEEYDIFYKRERDSIVLLAFPNHFELLGVYDEKEEIVYTLFKPTNEWIQQLYSQYIQTYNANNKK